MADTALETPSATPQVTQSPLASLITVEVNETYADAEKVETNTFDPVVYESTKAIIGTQVEQLEVIKRKAKLYAEQLKDLVDNNESLVQAQKEAQEATQKTRQIKTTIMQSQAAKELKANIQDTREEMKDMMESLSGHLLDLYQTTGVMEFEMPDGSVYEYKIVAKLGGRKQGS